MSTELITALGGLKAIMPLSNGTISSPVEFLDISLPAGYQAFSLKLVNWNFSVNDVLAAALSYDNGATWLCDVANSDSYATGTLELLADAVPGFYEGFLTPGQVTADSVMNLMANVDITSKILTQVDMSINPGSLGSFPTVKLDGCASCAGSILQYFAGIATLNPLAIAPPSVGRVNKIRLLPYGNEDVAPPTSGETITTGSYALFGVPTP